MSHDSLVTQVRELVRKRVVELGGTGTKSLADQWRTHSANMGEFGRRASALERETAEEIKRAAAPFKAYLADEPNPTIDDELKRHLQRLFAGTYGRTQLRAKVADIRHIVRDDGRKSVAFDLNAYRTYKGAYGHPNRERDVGSMSAVIRNGRGGRLVARHDIIYLDPSVRGTQESRFLVGILDRAKLIYPELGIPRIEQKADGPGAWALYKAGFEFNPAFETYNRDQLMAGIRDLYDQPRISVTADERWALIEMRSRLVTEESLPIVREIATMGPSVGRHLLERGWEGVMILPPPRPNGSAS